MTTEEQLHAAIADEPEEDTPRLAFADRLDELGGEANAARAEFIRLQVMLYRVNAETDATRAARRRASYLLERYRDAWGFPAGLLRPRCVVRRGFVDELVAGEWDLAGTPSDVLTLLPRHPITRVRLAGFRSGGMEAFETFEFLDVPAFRKVRHLEVATEQWTDELVGRLLRLEHFPELRTLALTGTGVTPVGVGEIAGCRRLARLRELRVGFAGYWLNPQLHALRGVRDEGAEFIAASPVLRELRELSLRSTGVGPTGARALAGSPNLAGLERLILTENPGIDTEGRAMLRARFGDRVFL